MLADEINRTPPKTQAALLEAMQENRVTVSGKTYELEQPFFVFATQNPIELEGTYPLPEAQLDRFMFNIVIEHLPEAGEMDGRHRHYERERSVELESSIGGEDLQVRFTSLVRRVPMARRACCATPCSLVRQTRVRSPTSRPTSSEEWVQYGASVRAAQFLTLGGKARALINGRYNVDFEDVRALAKPVLRHRVLTNFRADSERITSDDLIGRLVEQVPTAQSGMV